MTDKELTAQEELDQIEERVKNEVREAVKEFINSNDEFGADEIRNRINDDGIISEIVDGAVPIYNYDITKLGTLPEIFQHENTLPPAFDGKDTPINVIATSIYEILEEIAYDTLDDYLEEICDQEGIVDKEFLDNN